MFKWMKKGWRDVVASMDGCRLAGVLGWQDIRQRYRRSSLGPFWLTISMGVLIGALGLVFGALFAMETKEFIPFLSLGLILWSLVTVTINEGCTAFTDSEALIKQISLPLFIHILRVLWRNVIIFAHNLIIFPVVLLFFGIPLRISALLVFPGLVLLLLNLSWISLLMGTLCARFRDIPQIVSNLLQVTFYLTPIIWMPKLLPERAGHLMLDVNPFFHLIEIVRAPLLGMRPSVMNWVVALSLAVAGWGVTLIFYGRFRSRIAYWL